MSSHAGAAGAAVTTDSMVGKQGVAAPVLALLYMSTASCSVLEPPALNMYGTHCSKVLVLMVSQCMARKSSSIEPVTLCRPTNFESVDLHSYYPSEQDGHAVINSVYTSCHR
jgi:hypothetical protein